MSDSWNLYNGIFYKKNKHKKQYHRKSATL